MFNIKSHIPNTITCCNLLCGAVAVFMATQNAFAYAFLFILLGAVFDFFDGMSARALGVSNPKGVEMDSLADDITFGLAPAMVLFCYLRPLIGWWSLIALLMAAFSALRLAKFNLDTRQHESFIGLATPSNAIFWASICSMPYAILAWDGMPWVLLGLSLISCYLLVSEIPFFSLKFHDLSWKNNYIKYIFLVGSLVLVGFCIMRAIQYEHWEFALFSGAICIVWYIILNCVNLLSPKK